MATLVVMVVNKDECLVGWSHTPPWIIDEPKLSKVVDAPGDLLAKPELSGTAW